MESRFLRWQLWGPLVFCFAATMGCNSIERQTAATVAQSGAEVANATAASITAVRAGLDDYIEALYLLSPLTGRPAPSQGEIDNINEIARSLAARIRVFKALANAYVGLSALAAYDAETDIRHAIGDLAGAVNAYAETTRPGTSPRSPHRRPH